MLNYIGSKRKLLPFIHDTISKTGDLSQKVFCDSFAGTGCVSAFFKPLCKKIISSDTELYSFVLLQNLIQQNDTVSDTWTARLDVLSGVEGFIYNNYSVSAGRGYFSDANAARIDAVRLQIDTWLQDQVITFSEYYHLMASLLVAADSVANTACVYASYLKAVKPRAQDPIRVWPIQPVVVPQNREDHVYNWDIETLIPTIEGDILYLDPPYNERQYGANYHLLNTIVGSHFFTPKGKTGLPPYKKSRWCSRALAAECLDTVIRDAKFKWIFLSYNNEGLIPPETIRAILSTYGKYDLVEQRYQRFKQDSKRQAKADYTIEYIHVLEKV